MAGVYLWIAFLFPRNLLSDPNVLDQVLGGLQHLMALNPILAGLLWALWLIKPKERRLLYLALVFTIGTLSIVRFTVGNFFGLSLESAKLIGILSCGLVCFPFVALAGWGKGSVKTEIAANAGLVLTLLSGVFAMKTGDFKPIEYISMSLSTLSVLYFLQSLGRQWDRKKPLPLDDMRRLLIVAVTSVALLSQMANATMWSSTNIVRSMDLFFPVGFPLYFLVFLLIGFVLESTSNRKKEKASKVLHKISNLVTSSDSYDEKLSNIQDGLCAHLNAERSTIYLTDLKGGDHRLSAQAIYGPTDKLKQVALSVDPEHGLIGRVWKTRSPLLVDDFTTEQSLSADERSHIKSNEYSTNSCLLCPLVMGNEIIGVMTFSDKRDKVPFNENDLRMVQLVAKDIALLSLHARFQNMVDHFVSEKLNDLNKPA
jgi:putative methionine-R-sulfoxide reductase with GAF domain